jgi:hypothetical protein
MRRAPGWIILGQLALEITALVALLRLAAKRPAKAAETRLRGGADEVPQFITEVVDDGARAYRLRTAGGVLFAGFYSDGRVRLATPQGKRFSGIVVAQKAVVADLSADVSFEMEILVGDSQTALTMSGGPYDGQTLVCEPIP